MEPGCKCCDGMCSQCMCAACAGATRNTSAECRRHLGLVRALGAPSSSDIAQSLPHSAALVKAAVSRDRKRPGLPNPHPILSGPRCTSCRAVELIPGWEGPPGPGQRRYERRRRAVAQPGHLQEVRRRPGAGGGVLGPQRPPPGRRSPRGVPTRRCRRLRAAYPCAPACRPPLHAHSPPRPARYEKYDTNGVLREKTDDPFTDELNLVADKVQDLQLVRACGRRLACRQRPAAVHAASAHTRTAWRSLLQPRARRTHPPTPLLARPPLPAALGRDCRGEEPRAQGGAQRRPAQDQGHAAGAGHPAAGEDGQEGQGPAAREGAGPPRPGERSGQLLAAGCRRWAASGRGLLPACAKNASRS